MKKLIFSGFLLAFVFAFFNTSAFAQKETATGVDLEKDITLLRRDLRGEKKQLIALNLTLAGNVALILSVNPAFIAVFSSAPRSAVPGNASSRENRAFSGRKIAPFAW